MRTISRNAMGAQFLPNRATGYREFSRDERLWRTPSLGTPGSEDDLPGGARQNRETASSPIPWPEAVTVSRIRIRHRNRCLYPYPGPYPKPEPVSVRGRMRATA